MIQNCAELFSNNYGTWSRLGPNPGHRIKLPPERLRQLLDSEESGLACAYHNARLVGYCIVRYFTLSDGSLVSWVTQLVVDNGYRNNRIATHLLYSAWGFSGVHAWGLCTSNPLAVRALETATRRPCKRKLITDRSAYLLPELAERVAYIPDNLASDQRGHAKPIVDTEFHVDHQGLQRLRRAAARRDRPWALGSLDEGQEWLACTFGDQKPEIDAHRLDELLTSGDSVWVEAYERMALDQSHAWHSHTDHEIDFILSTICPSRGAWILDVGSGDGRHALSLAQRGLNVKGVDVATGLVERAQEEAASLGAEDVSVSFSVLDVRHEGCGEEQFDLALCLYDVIGSSADKGEDLALLRNVRRALRPGGSLIVSVMNTEVTLSELSSTHCPRTLEEMLRTLESLRPSNTMERSGEVFNPELLVYFDGIYYRKEQFAMAGPWLPKEMIVRDKRYAQDELTELLEAAHFVCSVIRPVRAGNWYQREPTNVGKEWLVVATAA